MKKEKERKKVLSTKPINSVVLDETGDVVVLHRTLGVYHLIALGIGAIIGAGLFSLTGPAAALYAGPAITLSFLIAAVGCAFAGLCYAEFASCVPVSGSAYSYAYSSLGELVAWVIGWDLTLEYAMGASTVATSWSRYFCSLLGDIGLKCPASISGGPMEGGLINFPAVCIVVLISLLLMYGIQESARVNATIVGVKLAVIFVFIAVGIGHVDTKNYSPFIPKNTGATGRFGLSGVLRGAGVIFFSYIGFDAVSCAAQDARNPQRDIPIATLASLAICTVIYIAFSLVLTGIVPYSELNSAAAVGVAIDRTSAPWLRLCVKVAILAGYTSVILVMLLGQSRVFLAMSRDGLLPPIIMRISRRYGTPVHSHAIVMVIVGVIAALLPMTTLGEATSIGTLFAFAIVCLGVIILRRSKPDLRRPFKTPLYPFTPIAGVVVNVTLMAGLGLSNWIRLIGWMAIGLVFYYNYGRHHSVVAKSQGAAAAREIDLDHNEIPPATGTNAAPTSTTVGQE